LIVIKIRVECRKKQSFFIQRSPQKKGGYEQ